MPLPKLKPQEIPLDHPDSTNLFQNGPEKPFVATRTAIDLYTHEVIIACWRILREQADEHNGLDYLQVFEDTNKPESLWFIEDGAGGAIQRRFVAFRLLAHHSLQQAAEQAGACHA